MKLTQEQRANRSRLRRLEWQNPEVRQKRIDGLRGSMLNKAHHERQRREGAAGNLSEQMKRIGALRDRTEMIQTNQRTGLIRRGKELPQHYKTAKSPKHFKAKFWKIRAPTGQVFSGWNLNHIIRTNAAAFLKEDVMWIKSACRASHALRELFSGRPNCATSWKGWTAVGRKQPSDDPLDRTNSTLADADRPSD